MPRGDGTGPAGRGPMSGRAAGYCAGYDMPGFANQMPGRGYGRGWGGGRGFRGGLGWRHGARATRRPGWMRFGGYAEPDPKVEAQELKNYAEDLQSELDAIKSRLARLEAGTGKVE